MWGHETEHGGGGVGESQTFGNSRRLLNTYKWEAAPNRTCLKPELFPAEQPGHTCVMSPCVTMWCHRVASPVCHLCGVTVWYHPCVTCVVSPMCHPCGVTCVVSPMWCHVTSLESQVESDSTGTWHRALSQHASKGS